MLTFSMIAKSLLAPVVAGGLSLGMLMSPGGVAQGQRAYLGGGIEGQRVHLGGGMQGQRERSVAPSSKFILVGNKDSRKPPPPPPPKKN